HAVADRGRDDHGRDVRELHQDPAPALAATGGTAGYVAARTGDGAPTSGAVSTSGAGSHANLRGASAGSSAGAGAGTWTYTSPASILLRGVWLAAFAALLLGSSVFLVEGTAARVADPSAWAQVQPPPGGVMPQGLSLDGMAYMRGWYPGDYAAITWLNAHLAGAPTIIEASNGPYQWYGRVAIYTGLPSVLGWSSHESQQRYPDEVYARQSDIQLFFTTTDPAVAHDILGRYGVRYVYVGDLERSCPLTDSNNECVPASAGAVAKYATLVSMGLLRPIYQNLGVTIYQVVG
ncbi:MAG TPA: hypothetical protein VIC85_00660, partial [Ktedonobacterales bacterium]